VQEHLEVERRDLVILIDNLEEYNMNNPEMAACVQGFLPAVQRFNADQYVGIICALPEELGHRLITYRSKAARRRA
jgi:hypothetical protein